MIFGDLDDPESSVREKLGRSTKLLVGKNTDSKVTYIIPPSFAQELEKRIVENPKMSIERKDDKRHKE